MMPSRSLGWIVISLATLVIAAGGFVAVMVILVFVGGPTSAAVCGGRALAVGSGAGLRFDGRWDGFDAFLDTGVPESLDLEEAEVTERARSFLTVENDVDEIRDVVVCFLGPEEAGGLGQGELRGKVAIPVLPDVSGRVRGRLDLSGPRPALEVTDIDLGSVPGFLTSRAGGGGRSRRRSTRRWRTWRCSTTTRSTSTRGSCGSTGGPSGDGPGGRRGGPGRGIERVRRGG